MDTNMGEEKVNEESIAFIKSDLIPEMVHNRCFCEAESREFVEFDSMTVEPFNPDSKRNKSGKLFRARTTVKFSGEPEHFPLVIKLLPDDGESKSAYNSFLNEEMFYNKMVQKYRGAVDVPRCYVADMGKYGMPVIVLEDLITDNYVTVDRLLDKDHLKLCVEALGKFHGRGLRLKTDNFSAFREFSAKLVDPTFEDNIDYPWNEDRIAEVLVALSDPHLPRKLYTPVTEALREGKRFTWKKTDFLSTICHGCFSREKLLFKYENDKPVDVKLIDWQTMRYCLPVIDLGPIVFANLPSDSNVSDVEEILTVYVDSVRQEYPEVRIEDLKREIIDNLAPTFYILLDDEKIGINELVATIRLLNDLGASFSGHT